MNAQQTIRTGRARRRNANSNNIWWGTVLVVFAESMLFFGLLYAFYYFRTTKGEWPPVGGLSLLVPGINTGLLLLSGATMRGATLAAKAGRQLALKIALAATMILGLLFVDGQVYEFLSLQITPPDSVFASIFYMLTGFHGLHVLGGVLILAVVTIYAFIGHIQPGRRLSLQCAELYWQFVVVAWIILFAALYLF